MMNDDRLQRLRENIIVAKKFKLVVYCLIAMVVFLQLRDVYLDFRSSMIQSRRAHIHHRNYFHNPILQELARRRPDFHNYRIVTIQYPHTHFTNVPGANGAYGFEAADGYNSSFPKRYLDFWKVLVARDGRYPHVFPGLAYVMVDIREHNCIDLLSLANVEYIISLQPLKSDRLVYVELVDTDKVDEHTARLYVYRNRSVLPRCFAPEYVEVFESDLDVINELKTRCSATFRETALVVRKDIRELESRQRFRNEVHVSNYRVKEDRISFVTSSKNGGFVVVLNSYSPYWKVVKGGLQPEVIPVYHAFQGVYVKPGRQEVVIEYSPPYVDKLRKYL